MKIELNKSEVKHGIIMFLKETCGIDAAAKDITLDDSYGRLRTATWEKIHEDSEKYPIISPDGV